MTSRKMAKFHMKQFNRILLLASLLISLGAQQATAQQQQQCSSKSIAWARQLMAHELAHMNLFASLWFNDLDQEELVENQKHSLAGIVNSGLSNRLLHSNSVQPALEIESSYFRSPMSSIKLLSQQMCQVVNSTQFSYTQTLAIGPITHHLDVVYQLPNELSLSQPLAWRYGQLAVQVPQLVYELTLRQQLTSDVGECPSLEVVDLIYVESSSSTTARSIAASKAHKMTITSFGLPANNQTSLQLDRLFDDYTRPTISRRLRRMVEFYLNSKTLPLQLE